MSSILVDQASQALTRDTRAPAAATAAPAASRAVGASLRAAVGLQSAAALVWLPQAALLSIAIGGIATGQPAQSALLPALGFAALGLLRAALDRAGARAAFKAARAELTTLRHTAVATVATRSPLDAASPSSGHVASTLTEQAEAIVPYIARFRPARFKATLVPLAILLCVAPLSWIAAIVLIVAAPLIPIFMALIGWRAKAASEKQLAEMGTMNAFLLDRLRGLTTIRAFDAIDLTARKIRSDADDLSRRTMAVLKIAFLSSAVLELFSALGVAMVAVYIGFHLLGELQFGAWGAKLSLTQGLFILLLAPAFFEPLRELSAVWHDRAAGEAAREAMAGLTEASPTIVGDIARVKPAHGMSAMSVRVDGLCFEYGADAHPAIDGLTLAVKPGERVAIMAPSGAGKSTLLALIAGLAKPTAGQITIDATRLDDASASRLRHRMAWIGQTPHIFTGTLLSNITLGRQMDSADTAAAIAAAQLAPLVRRRGAAVIGENGVDISGGEALRVAIARAAATPDVGLILADEPTAHLDHGTAQDIIDMLIAVSAGKTLIIATHDPELAARMDRVVTLSAPASPEDAP